MSSEHVRIDSHGPVSVVRVDRPPANAITLEFAREFDATFRRALESAPRAVVLTGTARFFCGGLDLKVVPSYSPEEQRAFLPTLNRLVGQLYALPIPLVGAINGHAIAGGMILALTPDYRIGPVGDARFGLTEARVGIPFPAATMMILHAELAPEHLRYITLAARTFGPEEARARGLLDELQPPELVLERAIEVAHDLAGMPADSYARIKHQLRARAVAQIEELNATGSDPLIESWVSPEAQKASASLLKGPKRG